jgi:8-oxo-dGTP pyrophosphatase MutT (NUDIX family)
MKPVLFVATKAIIKNASGQILLLRESGSYIDGINPGKWDVPGGRIDPGEKILDALIREVFEEAGILLPQKEYPIIDVIEKIIERIDRGELWQIIRIYYSVDIADSVEIMLSQDHDAFAWVSPSEFSEYDMCPDLLQVISR